MSHTFAIADATGQWNVTYFGSLADATLKAVADAEAVNGSAIYKQSN